MAPMSSETSLCFEDSEALSECSTRHHGCKSGMCEDGACVEFPSQKDILCGKDYSAYQHVGNHNFRDLIRGYLQNYVEASNRSARSSVVRSVYSRLKKEGFRFLRRHPSSDRWCEINPNEAKDKVGHAFRDRVPRRGNGGAKQSTKKSNGRKKAKSSSPSTPVVRKHSGSSSGNNNAKYNKGSTSRTINTNMTTSKRVAIAGPTTRSRAAASSSSEDNKLREDRRTPLQEHPIIARQGRKDSIASRKRLIETKQKDENDGGPGEKLTITSLFKNNVPALPLSGGDDLGRSKGQEESAPSMIVDEVQSMPFMPSMPSCSSLVDLSEAQQGAGIAVAPSNEDFKIQSDRVRALLTQYRLPFCEDSSLPCSLVINQELCPDAPRSGQGCAPCLPLQQPRGHPTGITHPPSVAPTTTTSSPFLQQSSSRREHQEFCRQYNAMTSSSSDIVPSPLPREESESDSTLCNNDFSITGYTDDDFSLFDFPEDYDEILVASDSNGATNKNNFMFEDTIFETLDGVAV